MPWIKRLVSKACSLFLVLYYWFFWGRLLKKYAVTKSIFIYGGGKSSFWQKTSEKTSGPPSPVRVDLFIEEGVDLETEELMVLWYVLEKDFVKGCVPLVRALVFFRNHQPPKSIGRDRGGVDEYIYEM